MMPNCRIFNSFLHSLAAICGRHHFRYDYYEKHFLIMVIIFLVPPQKARAGEIPRLSIFPISVNLFSLLPQPGIPPYSSRNAGNVPDGSSPVFQKCQCISAGIWNNTAYSRCSALSPCIHFLFSLHRQRKTMHARSGALTDRTILRFPNKSEKQSGHCATVRPDKSFPCKYFLQTNQAVYPDQAPQPFPALTQPRRIVYLFPSLP